ncbi:MAG: HNH endonuclease signature motif containing protein, partial [Nanoarchaeota archaeon]
CRSNYALSINRVLVKCENENCGKNFYKKNAWFKSSKHHFCSHKCQGEYSSKFLTKDNSRLFDRINVNCNWCQTEIPLIKSYLRHKHYFCSHGCEGLWRGKYHLEDRIYNWENNKRRYYGPSWKPAQKLARKRDNNICQCCGKTKGELKQELDVHHIIPFGFYGLENHLKANDLKNLICYCKKCHITIENEYNSLEDKKLIRDLFFYPSKTPGERLID